MVTRSSARHVLVITRVREILYEDEVVDARLCDVLEVSFILLLCERRLHRYWSLDTEE